MVGRLMKVDESGGAMAEKRDMVQIDSLEKYFGEDKERVHVLKGVSLNIPEGSLYTFLGPVWNDRTGVR